MMTSHTTEIPHAVLSEHLQARVQGRRIISAVFLTFRFEPDFFEQEILASVLDLPLSHAPAIRLLQLEDALRSEVDHVAVYYDRRVLAPGGTSAKLDVRRIAITHRTGYFHPKNVLLLTEAKEADSDGHRAQRLTVATMSANLTRAGWWENVEVCHVEEIDERAECAFRGDLLDLIRRVIASSPMEEDHDALRPISAFVKKLRPRPQRPADPLHPRLYTGATGVPDFLDATAGNRIAGLSLEVISPYFDDTDVAPLRDLCERFSPRDVRVFLPRGEDGAALCSDAVYEAVRKIPGASWAQLPPDLLRAGKGDQVKRRTVHAKVYRFFNPRKRYEALFVGSVNLTTAGHSKGGNFESGILVETEPKRTPDGWLAVDVKKPPAFDPGQVDDPSATTTALSVRYDWSRGSGAAYWDSPRTPGTLVVHAQGSPLFTLPSLSPQTWQPLSSADAATLERVLANTSFLGVAEDGGPEAVILVQEDGMAQKPSLLQSLSAAEILRYWSLLTPEQRAAFIDGLVGPMPDLLTGDGAASAPLARTDSSIFDSFAGVYHGFGALERCVIDALEEGRDKTAEYRLLGKKYDSLPALLDRVLRKDGESKEGERDVVVDYVIVLCAKQLVRRVKREYPEFHGAHRKAFAALQRQIVRGEKVRTRFSFGTPDEREAFLSWFDNWFLARAERAEVSV